MKNILQFTSFISATIFYMFCSSPVHAVGLGITTGIAAEDWSSDVNYSGSRQLYNGGFVFDTVVRRDRFINYRFTLLRENNSGDRIDMWGFSTTHEVGFAIVRDPNFRLWVGPRAKFSFYNKLKLKTNETVVNNNSLDAEPLGDVVARGVGPAIGINLHLHEQVSFLFSGALLFMSYTGDTDYHTTNGNYYDDMAASSVGLYLNAGVVIRINE